MRAGGKIASARKGAQEFVKAMDLDDYLVWMPFDSTVYPVRTEGPKSHVGENLIEEIGATPPGGGTALYDAVLNAYGMLRDFRKKHGDTVRYGMVVLSDGEDTARRSPLSKVEQTLKPEEQDPFGVQIHAICIGADCQKLVLKKIADAAHGKFWEGNTVNEMMAIYRSIAAHY